MKIKSFLIGAAASVVLASSAFASSLVDPPTIHYGDSFDLTISSDGVMIKDLTAIAVIGEGYDENKFVSDAGVTTQSSVMIVVADLDKPFDKSVNHVDVKLLLFAAAGVDETTLMKKPGNVPIDSLFPPTGSVKNWPHAMLSMEPMKPVIPNPLGNIAPFGWDDDVLVVTRLLRPHPLLDALPGLENAIDVKPLTLSAAGVDDVIAPRFFMEGGPQAIVRGGSRLVDARTTDIIVMVGLSSEVKRPQANVLIDEIGV